MSWILVSIWDPSTDAQFFCFFLSFYFLRSLVQMTPPVNLTGDGNVNKTHSIKAPRKSRLQVDTPLTRRSEGLVMKSKISQIARACATISRNKRLNSKWTLWHNFEIERKVLCLLFSCLIPQEGIERFFLSCAKSAVCRLFVIHWLCRFLNSGERVGSNYFENTWGGVGTVSLISDSAYNTQGGPDLHSVSFFFMFSSFSAVLAKDF